MSDKKELKRKSLSELKALIPQSVAGLQNYGGGDGFYGALLLPIAVLTRVRVLIG